MIGHVGFALYTAGGQAVVLEQEGFRFRNDNGSESTATWLASQDVNVTRESNTNTRLRFLENVTGDVASEQVLVQYRRQGAATWMKLGPPPQDA